MGLPNWLTILRIFLVPLFVIFIGYNKPFYALIVFVVAGITDALDGFLARKLNQITYLGKILDPIADKTLLVTSFIFIYTSNFEVKFPFWYVVIVISRDVYLLAGAILIYFLKGGVKINPSLFGKATTFFQIMSIIVILIANIYFIPMYFVKITIYLSTLFTILSTINYTNEGIKQLMR
ncbi:MAG TPA: CDP-diacylglycerol--glycerol-3-phosphate 3-phosphatidyltransferase [Hydrogenothermaceae bacterium]|nr:CDP-diacylglycerol--glycerol-3-phosphate 3-phosphatidyltransferase [Hydrogenothermaceae bacterium]